MQILMWLCVCGYQVTEDLPEAMAVMGFAFYIAPMLLPLRTEMPPGKAGDKLTMTASVLVILVIAQIVYGMLGAFGASRHGMQTNGNVMVNTWLPPKPQVTSSIHSTAILKFLRSFPKLMEFLPGWSEMGNFRLELRRKFPNSVEDTLEE